MEQRQTAFLGGGYERDLVPVGRPKRIVNDAGGEKTRAAKLLGISRTALYEKLRRMKERGM